MILAVADFATGQRTTPPPELKEALMTRSWGLPFEGGLKEQPPGFLERCTFLLNVYDAMQGQQRGMRSNVSKWAERNPDQYKTWQLVEKLRSGADA